MYMIKNLILTSLLILQTSLSFASQEIIVKFGPNAYRLVIEESKLVFQSDEEIMVQKMDCNASLFNGFERELNKLIKRDNLKANLIERSKADPGLYVDVQVTAADKFTLDARSKIGSRFVLLKNRFKSKVIASNQICNNKDNLKLILKNGQK